MQGVSRFPVSFAAGLLLAAAGPVGAQEVEIYIHSVEIDVQDELAWDSALLGLFGGDTLAIVPDVRFCFGSQNIPRTCSSVCTNSRQCAMNVRWPVDRNLQFTVVDVDDDGFQQMASFVVPDPAQCAVRPCVFQSNPSTVTIRFGFATVQKPRAPVPAPRPGAGSSLPPPSAEPPEDLSWEERICGKMGQTDPELDQMAAQALAAARDLGIQEGYRVEYGGYILKKGNRYIVPRPARGSEEDMISNEDKLRVLWEEGLGNVAKGEGGCDFRFNDRGIRCVASYHVHPARPWWQLGLQNWLNETFSTADFIAAMKLGLPEYIITPSSTVLVFRPSEGAMTPSEMAEGYHWLPSTIFNRSCHVREVEKE